MTTYAYLRVSADRQDVAHQRHGILEYANAHSLDLIQFVEDALSGRMACRERAIGQLLTTTATAGDVVPFAEISRMARSTLHVLEMLEIGMERKLHIHIAKQRMILDGSLIAALRPRFWAWPPKSSQNSSRLGPGKRWPNVGLTASPWDDLAVPRVRD